MTSVGPDLRADGATYNKQTECCLCGYPKVSHRGVVDWEWQDDALARHELQPDQIPRAVLAACSALMDAEARMVIEEKRLVDLERAEILAAERMNRRWESGLL